MAEEVSHCCQRTYAVYCKFATHPRLATIGSKSWMGARNHAHIAYRLRKEQFSEKQIGNLGFSGRNCVLLLSTVVRCLVCWFKGNMLFRCLSINGILCTSKPQSHNSRWCITARKFSEFAQVLCCPRLSTISITFTHLTILRKFEYLIFTSSIIFRSVQRIGRSNLHQRF